MRAPVGAPPGGVYATSERTHGRHPSRLGNYSRSPVDSRAAEPHLLVVWRSLSEGSHSSVPSPPVLAAAGTGWQSACRRFGRLRTPRCYGPAHDGSTPSPRRRVILSSVGDVEVDVRPTMPIRLRTKTEIGVPEGQRGMEAAVASRRSFIKCIVSLGAGAFLTGRLPAEAAAAGRARRPRRCD